MSKNIRSFSWFQPNLSWAFLLYDLGNAFDKLGHNFLPQSTNGMDDSFFIKKNKMLTSLVELQKFGLNKLPVDLDITYTTPQNFPQRFLPNSKIKAAIYNYEYKYWPSSWFRFYGLCDLYFPSSNFSAEVFIANNIPIEKIYVIPHGVDTGRFNASVPPIKLKNEKKFRFVSVCAPHYRKKLDRLLFSFCDVFDKNDDVALILKTKVYKHSDGLYNDKKNPNGRKAFEIVLGDIFKDLVKKYGNNMPTIEIIDGRVPNPAALYNAAHVNITTTGSECWGLPLLESMNCLSPVGKKIINIAPNYSGQLHFLNETNSLLIKGKLVPAKREEQYWHYDSRNMSFDCDLNHTKELMLKAYKEYDQLADKFSIEMDRTVEKYTWENAAQMIIDAVDKKIPTYVPGTYKLEY